MLHTHRKIGSSAGLNAVATVALFLLSSAATASVIRSDEFCFQAWFPGPPQQNDDERVTRDEIPIRARNFRFADRKGALLLTALKFDRHIAERRMPTYFESAIKSHARKVNGTVSNVVPTRFDGMPARAFDVAWRQEDVDWRSHNIICFRDGYSYLFGTIYRSADGSPARGKTFLQRVDIDTACIANRR